MYNMNRIYALSYLLTTVGGNRTKQKKSFFIAVLLESKKKMKSRMRTCGEF